MKTFVLVIITSMIVILTGCTFNDSEKEIVEDVTKQQTQSTSKAEQPNNMEQNYHIQSDDNNAKALNEYADVTGTYIYSTYNHLLEIEPLFSLNNVSDSDIESAKQSATNILEEYGKYMNVEIPESFEGFQDVHSVMIYEIEQLYKALHELTHHLLH